MEMITKDLIAQFVQSRMWTVEWLIQPHYNSAHVGPEVLVFNNVFLIPILMIKQMLLEAPQ